MSARAIATNKLIEIYKTSITGTAKQIACISALGRVGGAQAAKALATIYDGSGAGTKKQLATIEALGEIGHAPE